MLLLVWLSGLGANETNSTGCFGRFGWVIRLLYPSEQDSPNAFTQRNPPTSLNRQAALAAFLFFKTVVEVAGPRTGILSIPCVALVALRLTGHNLDAKHWASSQHPIRIRAHWHLLDPLLHSQGSNLTRKQTLREPR